METEKLTINGLTYKIYRQNDDHGVHSEYMRRHGCSTCALTCLLSALVPELANRTPGQALDVIKRQHPANFKRPMPLQMPISMWGITKVLEKYGIDYKFVVDYEDRAATEEIRQHLETGRPVLITVRNKDGKGKWAGSVHTMVLAGLDEDGKAIVCDSAQRSWADAESQRVKHGDISELLSFMWPAKKPSKSTCYKGRKGASGYILIK